VAVAGEHLRSVGEAIRKNGFPEKLLPLTVGLLGYGNVSIGVQQILDYLPVTRVGPDDISSLVEGGKYDSKTLYLTVFREEDLVERKIGPGFNLLEYYDHPELYKSRFDRLLPYFTLLINAIYWDSRYPRFVTWENLRKLARIYLEPKLSGIADITCDTNGSIECNVRSTDSDHPAYQVNPVTQEVYDGHTGDGIVLLAVDNLPCELPFDSSTFFSAQLTPLVPNILAANYEANLEESGLRPEIEKAVVVYRGELTENYQYLQKYLDA
jgi:alpha-aminoadipic semialdehyde synthase